MEFPLTTNQRLNGLARRMQKGDETAATELYNEFVGKVFGFCMNRVQDKATAEDLTQEIFLKVVSRIDTFRTKEGNFVGWFWQLARNTVIDYYRSNKEKSNVFSEFSGDVVEGLAVADTRSASEYNFEIDRLSAFVKQLSKDEQDIFELRFVADLSYREIAKILGKQEGALRVAVGRLKTKIQKHQSFLA